MGGRSIKEVRGDTGSGATVTSVMISVETSLHKSSVKWISEIKYDCK